MQLARKTLKGYEIEVGKIYHDGHQFFIRFEPDFMVQHFTKIGNSYRSLSEVKQKPILMEDLASLESFQTTVTVPQRKKLRWVRWLWSWLRK